jgi:hypothetical protein
VIAMLKTILATVAVIVVILIVVVALQPSDFHVERSARMAAPPQTPFAQVNDFHNWEAWNPFSKADPSIKMTYSGPASGVGAKYAWQGNKDVGEGNMTITESRPGELVRIDLVFEKPFAAHNTAEFRFAPISSNETAVTWSMFGHNGFMGKAIGLVMNMDAMIGGQFEKGLADMKAIVERASKN